MSKRSQVVKYCFMCARATEHQIQLRLDTKDPEYKCVMCAGRELRRLLKSKGKQS